MEEWGGNKRELEAEVLTISSKLSSCFVVIVRNTVRFARTCRVFLIPYIWLNVDSLTQIIIELSVTVENLLKRRAARSCGRSETFTVSDFSQMSLFLLHFHVENSWITLMAIKVSSRFSSSHPAVVLTTCEESTCCCILKCFCKSGQEGKDAFQHPAMWWHVKVTAGTWDDREELKSRLICSMGPYLWKPLSGSKWGQRGGTAGTVAQQPEGPGFETGLGLHDLPAWVFSRYSIMTQSHVRLL